MGNWTVSTSCVISQSTLHRLIFLYPVLCTVPVQRCCRPNLTSSHILPPRHSTLFLMMVNEGIYWSLDMGTHDHFWTTAPCKSAPPRCVNSSHTVKSCGLVDSASSRWALYHCALSGAGTNGEHCLEGHIQYQRTLWSQYTAHCPVSVAGSTEECPSQRPHCFLCFS